VRAPFLPYYFTVHDLLDYICDQRWNIIMYVLVLASQKGGAGKTTLSRHLAVEAERAGEGPVVLIDADPQGGLAGWWNRRRAESPVFFASRLEDLPKHIDQARLGGFKLVIIDTPPQATGLIRAVVTLADLVLIPTRPSPDDLDAVGRTIDIVDEAKKPMVFVINGATKNARITGQAAIALSQSGTVATATIHHSVAFPTSGIDGRTVSELDLASNSAQEIAELWTYVSARLRKYVKEAA
jgi:chromosome partitioning protein